jgi:ABC-type nitrate/sulfonate/bicarbonate transport system permease component
MSKDGRRWTSLTFVLAIVATLVVAFVSGLNERVRRLLIVILIVVQCCAYFWYTLSFIPFGRRLAKKLFGKCVKSMKE